MQQMCKANVSLTIHLYLGIHTSEQQTCNPNPADLIAACTKWDSSRGKHTKNTVVGTAAAGGGDGSGAVEGGSPAGGDESTRSGSQDGYGSKKQEDVTDPVPWKADLPPAVTNRLDLVHKTATTRRRCRRSRTSETACVDVAFVL